MRRELEGVMQRRVFLARLFVQAKCRRPARLHRQRRKKRGERIVENKRRSCRLSNRQTHILTGLAQI